MQGTMYELMRRSEEMDDDGADLDEAQRQELSDAEKFKEEYKTFYSDVKLSVKEDW